MEFVLVGIGGVLGAILRYELGKRIAVHSKTGFPVPTFIINITGAIMLGLVSSIGVNQSIYLLLGDGFLGAFTTFSTFMYEGFRLFHGNKKLNAVVYISSSLVLGLIGYFLGFQFGKLLIA